MKSTLTVIVMIVVVGFTSAVNAGDLNLAPKSPNKATSLSLIGTTIPAVLGISLIGTEGGDQAGAVLFLFGATFGPSLGHSYAGNGKRAATGIMIRMGCWFAAFGVAGAAADDGWDGLEVAAGAFLAATGLVTVSGIWDIASAGGSAREYNRKHGLGNLSVAPTFDVSKKQAGVRLSMQF